MGTVSYRLHASTRSVPVKVLKTINNAKAWSQIIIAIVTFSVTPTLSQAITIIDFDDRPGQPAPFVDGRFVQYLVADEYLPQGVLFDSAGGGIAILASPSPPGCGPSNCGNAVSEPNVAAGTGPGPVQAFFEPVLADFWSDTAPAVVDYVSITVTSTVNDAELLAYSHDGSLLGSDFVERQNDDPIVLTVSFPGEIHRVRIEGYFAFDDFEFDNLQEIPEPSRWLLLAAGVSCLVALRRVRMP